MPAMTMELTSVEYEELFNYLPDPIIVVDSEDRIVSANELAERMFGYRQVELLGQFVEILIPEAFRERHVEHRKAYIQDPKTRPTNSLPVPLSPRINTDESVGATV